MAAVDKLYLNNYDDLDELRTWALVNYPKLFNYFYSDVFLMDYEKFNSIKNKKAKHTQKVFKRQWEKICDLKDNKNKTLDELIDIAENKLSKFYANRALARLEAMAIYNNYAMDFDEIYETTSIAVMNVPTCIDKFLKWRCPIDCVRTYLHNQCGVSYKMEKFYKLFWKK